jgi:hypothetical protein
MMEMKQKAIVGALCLMVAGSGFAESFTRLSDGNWSDLTKWRNHSLDQTPATNFPTSADNVLLNANRVLTVDTNAFASAVVTPNAANSTSTLILTNSAAGYTLTAASVNIGINSQVNSHGYAYQSAGTVAANSLNVYGALGGTGTYNLMGGTVSGTSLNVGGVNSLTAVGNAWMNQTGGDVSETTVNVAGIGTQTYDMSGGTLIANNLNVDTADANAIGTATFNQTAGTVTAETAVGADGTYNLSGSGILNATTLDVSGAMTHSGGSSVSSTVTVNSGGSHTLSGTGSLIATNLNVSGTMAQTGGTLNAPVATTVSSGGNFTQSGGTATHSALTVNNGGTAGVSGTATLNAIILNADGTVNQSGGIANTQLNVGAGGNYNLAGGTFNSTTASDVTVDGTLTINGGTLHQDLNGANDIVEINGSGVVVLESGLLQTENGIAQSVVNLRANMEISGGTLDLAGQARMYNNMKVIGDAATIQIERLGANRTQASFTFELGADGVSTIEGVGGYASLAGASLLIDGTDYVHGGGTFTNLLFNPANLASIFNVEDVTIANFADGLTVNFFQDQTNGADWVGIEIIPEPAVLGLVAIFGGGILVSRRIFNI